jgi:hypothetical protein
MERMLIVDCDGDMVTVEECGGDVMLGVEQDDVTAWVRISAKQAAILADFLRDIADWDPAVSE